MKFVNLERKFDVVFKNGFANSTLELIAEFEDNLNNFPYKIHLSDSISLKKNEISEILDEIATIENFHPFLKLKLCESPVELKFFVFSLQEIPGLRPQVVFEPYRIDLAIPEKKVAIEIDGHDFHKTRQQRTRDAKRDRFLQIHGWQVIRFTGSEVHNDVFGCIKDAKDIIANIV